MFDVKTTREWVTEAHKRAKIIHGFLPLAVMRDTGLSRETVVKECKEIATEGLLEVVYEADCPHCFSIVTYGDKPEPKIVDCILCGHEDIVVEAEDYSPRFILKKSDVDLEAPTS